MDFIGNICSNERHSAVLDIYVILHPNYYTLFLWNMFMQVLKTHLLLSPQCFCSVMHHRPPQALCVF